MGQESFKGIQYQDVAGNAVVDSCERLHGTESGNTKVLFLACQRAVWSMLVVIWFFSCLMDDTCL